MTVSEFASLRESRTCEDCGCLGVTTELNPNNNGLLVRCPDCGSNRPWGSVLYLKQNTQRRTRPPLPKGETLDSIWAKYGDRCVMCSAPTSFLKHVGIGRQVHHVVPFASEGHRGPLIPICVHCHELANARQRVYWFMQRAVLSERDDERSEDAWKEHPRALLTPKV
jgi:hypothetical protein